MVVNFVKVFDKSMAQRFTVLPASYVVINKSTNCVNGMTASNALLKAKFVFFRIIRVTEFVDETLLEYFRYSGLMAVRSTSKVTTCHGFSLLHSLYTLVVYREFRCKIINYSCN